MKCRNLFFLVGLLILLTIIPVAITFAAVPKLINFQARLTDNLGMPLDGSYRMQFSLYDDPSIGTQLWSSGARNVSVADGILDVVLGSVIPFFGTEFSGTRPLYIQIDIEDPDTSLWETLEPRQRLTAVPFALQAGNAETLNGLVETDFADVDHGHDFGDLHGEATDAQIPDTITVNRAATAGDADTVDGLDAAAFARVSHSHDALYVNEGQANSISSGMIVDGTITAVDIHDNTVTAAKIAPNIVSSLDGVVNHGGNIDLVAGANVTITPNDGANTITIAAAGGGTTDHGALSGLGDDDHPQYLTQSEGDGRYVNASGDSVSGDLTVGGRVYANGDIAAGTNDPGDNDFLFMDGVPGAESEYFAWIDGQDTFWTTNDLAIDGVLQTGGIQANPGYNRFGGGTGISGNVTDSSDVLVSDDLDVVDDVHIGGALTVGSNLRTNADLFVGTADSGDNDYIWMDGANETLFWSESEDRFRFSDDLYAAGGLETVGNITAGGNFQYAAPQTFYLQMPALDFKSTGTDIYELGSGVALVSMWPEFEAPLRLPQGAVITHIRYYFYDNTGQNFELTGYLYRRNINTAVAWGPDHFENEHDIMSEVFFSTSAASPSVLSIGDTAVDNNIIDNQNYQYGIRVEFKVDSEITNFALRFYGARIEYTLQTLRP